MYKQRNIILIPFPFSDLSTSKKRPALIISNDNFNSKSEDVIVCAISSTLQRNKYTIDLNSSNLETGVLPSESIVKVNKIFTISKSKILKKFSSVNKDYFTSVTQVLIELFNNK